MKRLIKRAISEAGFHYAKRQYMPRGIDWLWDISRVCQGLPIRTVFNVSANVGQTTLLIKERFPEAHVHAFEPVSATHQPLGRNVGQLAGVTCHRLALTERVGKARVTAAEDSVLNRLLSDVETPDGSGIETVDTETVDHFCSSREIAAIDILKIDAEGSDLRVRHGSQGMLQGGRVAFVLVEVGFEGDDPTHVHLRILYDCLKKARLNCYAFYDYYYEKVAPPTIAEDRPGLSLANMLFVSPATIG